MKAKHILSIFLLLPALLMTSGCEKDLEDSSNPQNIGWAIPFSAPAEDEVTVSTKSTLGKVSESIVYNMFVFVFSSNGKKLQTAYYSSDNKDTQANVQSQTNLSPIWYVNNNTTESETTTGYIKIPSPSATGCTIYAIANINADMINVSPERLKAENLTLTDLKNFVATLNQEVVYRNGYFPMSGSMPNVDITASGITINSTDKVLHLKRMDAKIEFNFTVDHTHTNQTYYDENGNAFTVDEGVKSFTPISWRVVNVPKSEFALDYASRGITASTGHDAADYQVSTNGGSLSDYFFNTDDINFDTITDDGTAAAPNSAGGTFSFYMTENRRTPKGTPPSINTRSAQLKYSGTPGTGNDGIYINDPKLGPRSFKYADDYSTYVVVTGNIAMDVTNDKAGHSLSGEVQYIIHLGDFGSNVADYNTERNTDYKYTVTIKGLHAIRLEVETSVPGNAYNQYNTEMNSGASGTVSIAKEQIAICDCHYVSKTMTFHFSSINEDLTWYVKTPFCEGEPDPVTGSTATCPDYKWVHFRLNKKDGTGTYYADQRRKYISRTWESYERTSANYRTASQNAEGDGTAGLAGYNNDGLMDIIQMCAYIKAQHKLASDSYGNYIAGVSDFDNGTDSNGDGDWSDSGDEEPKISVTVFVDEYYYDSNPKTGAVTSDLWKSFVNQHDRYAYLLCKSGRSRDQESRMTGSAITIQQHAIQSIYNTDENYSSLQTAWGLERTDEFDGKWVYWSSTSSENRNNNLAFNGLANTLREWGLCSTSSYTFTTGQRWGTFMNFEVNNDTPQLNSTYQYLRYNCMNRNRDNNGDGIIDRSEMRWYMASLRQLIGIYVGEGLIDPASRLYNRSASQQASGKTTDWMQHVISSTEYGSNSNNPTLIWAEEGISTGPLSNSQEGASYQMTVRCIRNLGMAADHDLSSVPQDYVTVSNNADNTYTISAEHLNKAALRYYTSRELDMGDQNSNENRLYSKFQVYSSTTSYGSALTFNPFNTAVTNAVNNGSQNPYCPAGYRLPNQRELAMMAYYISGLGDSMSRTKWSFGALGNNKVSGKYGFVYSGGNITLTGTTLNKARCVRDVK